MPIWKAYRVMIKIISKHKWWAKKLSYLIGALRSGTTWLQAILASDPSVFSRPEAHTRPRNFTKGEKNNGKNRSNRLWSGC